MLMVKPALAYLDVIRAVRESFPTAAGGLQRQRRVCDGQGRRQRNGWMDERAVALEMLTGIKRAGADLILTYFAKRWPRWLNER